MPTETGRANFEGMETNVIEIRAAQAAGRTTGGVDAWVSGNHDPRGRFIAAPFDERLWQSYKAAYEIEFKRVTKLRKS